MLLISLKIHHLSRLVLLSSLILLTACAGRPAPAPVIIINTQVQEISPWDNADTHQVQEGETLYGIAWLYGLDYQMLAQNNNLQEPFAIGVGQKLNLVKKTIKQASLSADTKEVIVKTPNRKTVAQNNKSVYRNNQKLKRYLILYYLNVLNVGFGRQKERLLVRFQPLKRVSKASKLRMPSVHRSSQQPRVKSFIAVTLLEVMETWLS